MFLDRVHVVESYPDWVIRSERLTINVPSVCVTKEYFKFKKAVKFSRRNLYLRDMYQCQYCGEVFESEDLTLDHVIPRAMGGKTTWENSVTACKPCNHKKGAKLVKPMREPYRPDHFHLINKWKSGTVHVRHKSWYQYLGIDPEE